MAMMKEYGGMEKYKSKAAMKKHEKNQRPNSTSKPGFSDSSDPAVSNGMVIVSKGRDLGHFPGTPNSNQK